MNVHGVYDTSARIMTYESREEYQKQLQQEAGVSGSYFGFSAGVKQAWGESTATAKAVDSRQRQHQLQLLHKEAVRR